MKNVNYCLGAGRVFVFWLIFGFSVMFTVWNSGFVVAHALTVDEITASPQTSSDLHPAVNGLDGGALLRLSAKSAVVLNQSTGEILYDSNGSASRVPASLVKLTTALVALDTVPDWNSVCVLKSVDQVGGVHLNFSRGYAYRMNDLLQATLIPSFNDAAHALARCSGVSVEQFVIRMNEKVRQLGAWNTVFVEPTGLSSQNVTTALDVARIANAAFSTDKIRDIASKSTSNICSVKPVKKCQALRSTDELLRDQDMSVVAGKTGFVEAAGYNFTASVKDDAGNYYITVVLGSSSKQGRFTDSKKLWTFAKNNILTHSSFNPITLK